MKKFNYICNKEDRNEMRVWMFNKNLFVNGPKYYNPDTLFIRIEDLIKAIKSMNLVTNTTTTAV